MTREQQLMNQAYLHVTQVQSVAKIDDEKYGGLCHTFPVLLRTCGLCQTLAFLQAKGKPHHQQIVKNAEELLLKEQLLRPGKSILDAVRLMPMVEYVMATRLLLQGWIFYKRFAESVLKVKPGEGEDTDD